MKLLMISGDRSVAEGKRGAFYNTLEEFSKHWERIDIIVPKSKKVVENLFGNVFIHTANVPLIFHPWFIASKGKQIFKSHKFDVITVHEFPPFYNGIGARFLWNKIKLPYVLEIHHVPGYPKSASFKEKVYLRLFKSFIRYDIDRAVAVRVVNQNQTPEFLKKYGVPNEKIKYIPSLYLDLDIFKPSEVEKKYDLIFIGRLVANKGLNIFLEAVRQSGRNALMVGGGPMLESAKRWTEKYNLNNEIGFYGWAKDQNEIAELLNESRLLIMTSYNEGGPRVVAEAMACGVPVLATPVGFVPDLPGDAITKISWDPKIIMDEIKNVLADVERYQRQRDAGIKWTQTFERRVAIKNYAEAIQNLK